MVEFFPKIHTFVPRSGKLFNLQLRFPAISYSVLYFPRSSAQRDERFKTRTGPVFPQLCQPLCQTTLIIMMPFSLNTAFQTSFNGLPQGWVHNAHCRWTLPLTVCVRALPLISLILIQGHRGIEGTIFAEVY